MRTIKGICPHCGHRINAPKEYIGRQIQCDACDEQVLLEPGRMVKRVSWLYIIIAITAISAGGFIIRLAIGQQNFEQLTLAAGTMFWVAIIIIVPIALLMTLVRWAARIFASELKKQE
jgi:DNA-directed RNA polymerase subunit RPC12/RpoP